MCDGQISTAYEIFVKSQYMNCMQDKTKWYWEQKTQHNNIFFHTHSCTSMLICHHRHQSKKYQKVFAVKSITQGFAKDSYMFNRL